MTADAVRGRSSVKGAPQQVGCWYIHDDICGRQHWTRRTRAVSTDPAMPPGARQAWRPSQALRSRFMQILHVTVHVRQKFPAQLSSSGPLMPRRSFYDMQRWRRRGLRAGPQPPRSKRRALCCEPRQPPPGGPPSPSRVAAAAVAQSIRRSTARPAPARPMMMVKTLMVRLRWGATGACAAP